MNKKGFALVEFIVGMVVIALIVWGIMVLSDTSSNENTDEPEDAQYDVLDDSLEETVEDTLDEDDPSVKDEDSSTEDQDEEGDIDENDGGDEDEVFEVMDDSTVETEAESLITPTPADISYSTTLHAITFGVYEERAFKNITFAYPPEFTRIELISSGNENTTGVELKKEGIVLTIETLAGAVAGKSEDTDFGASEIGKNGEFNIYRFESGKVTEDYKNLQDYLGYSIYDYGLDQYFHVGADKCFEIYGWENAVSCGYISFDGLKINCYVSDPVDVTVCDGVVNSLVINDI